MFVYNKGKLLREATIPVANSQTEFIFRLTHVTSSMTIEVKYNTDGQINNNPYKVYREVDGSYVIYEEFYRKNKTTKENFEEAILFFEDNIYKILGETPPVEGTPNPDDNTPPETFQEVPIVGDIIQVGNKYGVVTDIVDTQVVTKELSKEEAMRILKNQKNALMSISQAGNLSDDLDFEIPSFDDGGSLSSTVIFDTQKDKITILRVKPPQEKGTPPPPPQDGDMPPPPPEPQPDNVKDPFEETPPPPPDKGKDQEGKDQEGKDQEGKDQEGEGEPNGEGEDGEGSDNEGEGADAEFGDDDSEMQTLEEMLKKIKDDFDRGKSTKDIQAQQDLDILENALSTSKDQIKNIFRSKSLVMSAIGRRNIFGTDNEQRLNDTLNEIFK
jgi:predicted small secreted protein